MQAWRRALFGLGLRPELRCGFVGLRTTPCESFRRGRTKDNPLAAERMVGEEWRGKGVVLRGGEEGEWRGA